MRRRTFLAAAFASAADLSAQRRLGSIAFVQPEGLTFRTLPDGPFIRVATGSRIRSPRFSPSGRWIAFHDGDALYVATPEGAPPAPLPPGEFVWMPGQDVLAVMAGSDLLFFDAHNGWRVPSLIRKGAGLPVFDPTGAEFVFSAAVRQGTGSAGEPVREGQIRRGFYTGQRNGSELLVSKHQTNLIPFGWTRDSRFILYWEDPDFSASLMADGLDLYRAAASGGPAQPLNVTTLVHGDLLALSPRGNRLAVTAGAGRETWMRKRIAILDLDTLAVRHLTDEATSALTPAWSPGGPWVAFSAAPASNRPNLGERRIWMADASGSRPPRRVTDDDGHREEKPLWSASGSHMLFCRVDPGGSAALWLTGGGEATQVSAPLLVENGPAGFYGYVDWGSAFDWFRGASAGLQ